MPKLEGLLGDTIIVHLGTNGSFSNDTLKHLHGRPAPASRSVIVLTWYADRGWVDDNNAKLMALPARYPNVTILDWHQLATQCPGDCFYDDGIHLNQNGQNYYASLVLHGGCRRSPQRRRAPWVRSGLVTYARRHDYTCSRRRHRGRRPDRLQPAVPHRLRVDARPRHAGHPPAARDHAGAGRARGRGDGARRLCVPAARRHRVHRRRRRRVR